MTVLSHLFVVSLPNKLYLYESAFEQTKTFPVCRWIIYSYLFYPQDYLYGAPHYYDLLFIRSGLRNALGG